jgi:peptidyl-prolyl cis-trans isomerase A (cyclophilin A)
VSAISPKIANATVVEFQTNMGTFEVNLYDNATPTTVTNFLDYVNSLAYTNSIFHRAPPGFVVQGGGFVFNAAVPPVAIPANAAIQNEPEFSNVRGTIAMAKTSQPNSATNQWFFNLTNSSANLDIQNEGFTVFGEVIGTGMDVVDAIAALPVYDFTTRFSSGAFQQLPLQNYTATDFGNNVTVDVNHLIIISAIVISDATVDSAAGLNPPLNTLINQPPPAPPPAPSSGGGGGSLGFLTLFGLLLLARFNRAGAFRQ